MHSPFCNSFTIKEIRCSFAFSYHLLDARMTCSAYRCHVIEIIRAIDIISQSHDVVDLLCWLRDAILGMIPKRIAAQRRPAPGNVDKPSVPRAVSYSAYDRVSCAVVCVPIDVSAIRPRQATLMGWWFAWHDCPQDSNSSYCLSLHMT